MAGGTRDLPGGGAVRWGASRWAAVVALDVLARGLERHWVPVATFTTGGLLLTQVHGTSGPFELALLLLLLGLAVTWVVGRRSRPAARAFALTYGACVLAAGLSQTYSQWAFGMPMSTPDTGAFFGAILRDPPFYRIGERFPVNAPYAVIVWQQVYTTALHLGFSFGVWIGVLFNALLVGLTGGIMVLAAGELVDSDPVRLRRVGTLAAWCGMFWLFGALFLRDAFTLLVNTVVLWMLIRVVHRPRAERLLAAGAAVLAGAWCMLGLRPASAPLFAAFAVLAAVTWLWLRRPGLGRLLAVVVVLMGAVLLYARVQQALETVSGSVAAVSETYRRVGTGAASEGSLGMALIVGQPLPVRLALGSVFVLISPVPLWATLSTHAVDYLHLKTAHGIYMVVIMPLVILGGWTTLRALRGPRRAARAAALFVLLYALAALLAVAATSLETRHFGQFLPAVILLAGLPDLRDPAARGRLRLARAHWLALVVLIHLAWSVLKFAW